MSIYSTVEISRQKAIEKIMSKLFSSTDEQLQSLMFDLFGDECYHNFRICSVEDAEDKTVCSNCGGVRD